MQYKSISLFNNRKSNSLNTTEFLCTYKYPLNPTHHQSDCLGSTTMSVLNFKLLFSTVFLLILLQLCPVQGDIEVEFLLYESKNNSNSRIKAFKTPSTCPPGYMSQCQTRVLIHDWNQSVDSQSILSLRSHYNVMGKYNQIVVDHSKALKPNDPDLNRNVSSVGKEMGQMLAYLNSSCKMQLGETLVVGIGIGAHVAGNAGKWLQMSKLPKIGTIIGLDPTRDLEEHGEKELSRVDATSVVVYHTNVYGKGIYKRLGTADVYVNDHKMQPRCTDDMCSHRKALGYFLDTPLYTLRKCSGIPETQDHRCHKSKVFVEVQRERDFNKLLGVYWLDTKGN